MDYKDISRQEYIARINRVMDYVNNNLDKMIDLAVMADIASFSPYHFHRIFTFIAGETPNNFVSRIRIERAASLLWDRPKESISEIALRCGFINISSFSRTFKSYFGLNAKEFRKLDKAIYLKDGIRYSKNGKQVSKIGKDKQQVNYQLCSVEPNKLIIMDTKIEIKQMPALNLIYCRHMGAFDKIGQTYEKLFKWAEPRGLITSAAKTVTVYHDDPAITSVEKVRQDACITVDKDVKVEGEIGKLTLPAGKYAVGRFEIGATEFEKAWNTIWSWLTQSGYQPGEGATYELYHNDPTKEPGDKFILDICFPVRPL